MAWMEETYIDYRNENFEKIFTMRKLAMRRLAKSHKTGVSTHTRVRPSASLLKETSTFERVCPKFATGKKSFLK